MDTFDLYIEILTCFIVGFVKGTLFSSGRLSPLAIHPYSPPRPSILGSTFFTGLRFDFFLMFELELTEEGRSS